MLVAEPACADGVEQPGCRLGFVSRLGAPKTVGVAFTRHGARLCGQVQSQQAIRLSLAVKQAQHINAVEQVVRRPAGICAPIMIFNDMQMRQLGRRVAGCFLACVAGFCLTALAGPALPGLSPFASTAQAEDGQGRGEAVIGTFRLKGRRDAPDDAGLQEPMRPADRSPPAELTLDVPGPVFPNPADVVSESEEHALDLLQAGIAALEAGDEVKARQNFEQVIATAPESGEANRARRHLAVLYQRQAPPDAMTRAGGRGTGAEAGSSVVSPKPSVRKPPLSAEEKWQRQRKLALYRQDFISMVGDRVFFGAGSQKLGARARQVLAAQATWLKKYRELAAIIEGHADEGTMASEQQSAIARARADAVYSRLVQEGVEPSRLQIKAVGQANPVARCAEKVCAAQNRRAVTGLEYFGDLTPEVADGAVPGQDETPGLGSSGVPLTR